MPLIPYSVDATIVDFPRDTDLRKYAAAELRALKVALAAEVLLQDTNFHLVQDAIPLIPTYDLIVAQTQLQTDINTTLSTVVTVKAATLAAFNALTITSGDKRNIDAVFEAGMVISLSVARSAASAALTAIITRTTNQLLSIAHAISIGFSQTWQNVTLERAQSTTYINTMSKPIVVAITVTSDLLDNVIAHLHIDGIPVGSSLAASAAIWSIATQLTGIVPAGGSYNLTGSSTLSILDWAELK